MPFKQNRQYRSFAASNFQPVTREAVLDAEGNDIVPDEPTYKVRGYFTTFNDEYVLRERYDFWPAVYEQIDRHAFDNCDVNDVIMQYDHSGDVLARTRNGSLTIGFDDHGGWCEAYLGGCQRARDLYESICNGLVVEMSFGFIIDNNEESDGFTEFKDESGDWHSTVTAIRKLYDVSIVSIPANPGTDVEDVRKRSYLDAIIEADIKASEKQEADRRAKEEVERTKSALAMLALRAKAMGLSEK